MKVTITGRVGLMIRMALLISAALASSGIGAAQLYRWVDENGRVEWRDTPPPPSARARSIEQRRLNANAIETSELPYSVQLAQKNYPVTLWISNCGAACNDAKNHLVRRGVPHSERDATGDNEAFRKATGGNETPVMLVGALVYKGYEASAWDTALDSAGYPRTALSKPQQKPKPSVPQRDNEPKNEPKSEPKNSTSASVRLYTTSDCGPNCENAKEHLKNRGVAYQEILISEPAQIDDLRKLTGDVIVPVMLLKHGWVQGFSAPAFDGALNKAGLIAQ
jgi:glutaredoxin